jgi:hypothetical protein
MTCRDGMADEALSKKPMPAAQAGLVSPRRTDCAPCAGSPWSRLDLFRIPAPPGIRFGGRVADDPADNLVAGIAGQLGPLSDRPTPSNPLQGLRPRRGAPKDERKRGQAKDRDDGGGKECHRFAPGRFIASAALPPGMRETYRPRPTATRASVVPTQKRCSRQVERPGDGHAGAPRSSRSPRAARAALIILRWPSDPKTNPVQGSLSGPAWTSAHIPAATRSISNAAGRRPSTMQRTISSNRLPTRRPDGAGGDSVSPAGHRAIRPDEIGAKAAGSARGEQGMWRLLQSGLPGCASSEPRPPQAQGIGWSATRPQANECY